MTDEATDRSQRIWTRLNLYMSALAVCEAAPDCMKVEQTGTVAVPIRLMRKLQEAVEGYFPGEERVRHYQ